MKLAVMQPYFFPYIGYFELMHRVDKWVVFDSVQYIRKGWVNRNRILHPAQGWMYITAPVAKHSQQTLIKDILLAEGDEWRRHFFGQLQHYRKAAPQFEAVVGIVQGVLKHNDRYLADLNVRGLDSFASYLGIGFDHSKQSVMELNLGEIGGPGDWGLRISEALGASEYINPPGGAAFYDQASFGRAGIKLTFLQQSCLEYETASFAYEAGLSIIDVCMWNEPAVIKAYLDQRADIAEAA